MTGRRGVTLVEMMVAVAVGSAVTLAALTLTTDFQRFYHRHSSELDLSYQLRSGLALLAEDIRNAGVGVGYRSDGRFAGILGGTYTLQSGATPFQDDNRSITTEDGALLTDDLGVRRAVGDRRTVLFMDSGTGEICHGLELEANDLLSVTARDGRGGCTLRVVSAVPAACSEGVCLGGCTRLTWTADSTYVSDPSVSTQRFTGGDLFSEYETVVWFVAVDAEGRGQLRRAGTESAEGCTGPTPACGGEVADGVELLQYLVWRFDPGAAAWVEVVKDGQEITADGRLRVDIELVARARGDPGVGANPGIVSQIQGDLCVPAPCGSARGTVPRRALRTSVEVRNAGRLVIR